MPQEENGEGHASLARDMARLLNNQIYITTVTNTRYSLKDSEIEAISNELDAWLDRVFILARKHGAEGLTVNVGGSSPPTVSATFSWDKKGISR
ncbi:MAG: hypothetical protein R6T78_01905 [Dehalococcoidales bacterium]